MSITIINGTNSSTSRIVAVQNYIEEYFNAIGEVVSSIQVHTLPAEYLITGNYLSEEIKKVNEIVAASDTVIILTPVYKASYSGILKTYLDLLPQKAFENKTVLPIAVGGTHRHLLAIEYALNPVISVLGSTNILNSVYIIDKQIERLEQGGFTIDEEAEKRLLQELSKVTVRETVGN